MGAPTYLIDPRLKEWATDKQKGYIDAVNKYQSLRKASRELGVAFSTVNDSIQCAKKKAAIFGWSPEHDLTRPVAYGQKLRGASTLYRRGEPEPVLQWVKSSLDEEKAEQARQAAFKALCEDMPREKPRAISKPGKALAYLVTVYTLTDCHVGMLAWGKESGEDWDLKIAEDTLVGCFAQMIAAAPDSRIGLLNQLGDFLHFDGLKAITPEHGHLLDADGRFEKIVEVAVRILRRVIRLMLDKHELVEVLCGEGNHDPSASVWLRRLFACLFENEPRVKVMQSPLPYYVFEHGETMLGFHHGHLSKNDALPLLFAAQFAREWGRTTKRYIHTGHRHHVDEKEHSGVVVVQHPTIAARDAYAARGGWIAMRQVQAITYHSKFGRVRVDASSPEMLVAA